MNRACLEVTKIFLDRRFNERMLASSKLLDAIYLTSPLRNVHHTCLSRSFPMNIRKTLLALFVLALGVGTFAVIRPVKSVKDNRPPQQQVQEVPEHVPYIFLFHQLASLKQQADEADRQGKNDSSLRSLFKNQAALNDEQASALDTIAFDCVREVAQQDAKAKVIIDAFKARHPGGKLQRGETLPPPPAELTAMQEERNAIILRARDRLHTALGEQEFNRFEEFVKQHVVPNVKTVR